MPDQFSRTRLLIGDEAVEKLSHAHVAIFGIGGVGGYVAGGLVRGGIGGFDLIDSDTVSVTNLNRQIIALHSTIGRYKTEVMKERMLDINPAVTVNIRNCFYLPETAGDFDFSRYSYVVDAVDTVTAKLLIITRSKEAGVPVISCMGAGNKLDPAAFQVADIYNTVMCPLAKVMRHELKKRGIDHLKVVFSTEKPVRPASPDDTDEGADVIKEHRAVPGSTAFVPPAAGMLIASEVVKDLLRRGTTE